MSHEARERKRKRAYGVLVASASENRNICLNSCRGQSVLWSERMSMFAGVVRVRADKMH